MTRCQCYDAGCVHVSGGSSPQCYAVATVDLVRVDMDNGIIAMFQHCANDALASGPFALAEDAAPESRPCVMCGEDTEDPEEPTCAGCLREIRSRGER